MTRRSLTQGLALALAAVRLPASGSASLALHQEDHLLATESARGFRAALRERLNPAGPHAIYAGLRDLSELQSSDLVRRVWHGQWVLIESGLSFATDRESNLHRDRMRDLFGFRIGKTTTASNASDHYVRYRWPLHCFFRHFTEFTTVQADDKDVIAHVGEIPVAIRKSFGLGGVVYLGSPLGPILLAKDSDAERLTRALADQLVFRSSRIHP